MSNKGSFNKNSFYQQTSSEHEQSKTQSTQKEETVDSQNDQFKVEIENPEVVLEEASTNTQTKEKEVVEEVKGDSHNSSLESEVKSVLSKIKLRDDRSNYQEVKKELLKQVQRIQDNPNSEDELNKLLNKKIVEELISFANLINQKVCIFLENNKEDFSLKVDRLKTTKEELTKQLERANREKETAVTYANEKLISGPLKNFVETLQLSLNSSSKVSNEKFLEFIDDIKNFNKDLRKNLEKFDIFIYGKAGDKFDPHIHEAISQIPAQTDTQVVGTIAYVSSEGFKLHDRIIEPAKVIVWC